MSLLNVLIAGLLLALVLNRGTSEDFKEKWVTRPPVEYEFPHVIYLAIPETDEFCSGSLIHESWVLTAASCMYKEGTYKLIKDIDTAVTVYAGVKDRSQLNSPKVQKRQSVKVRIPDEADNGSTYYSPALIRVDHPFTLDQSLGVESVKVSRKAFENDPNQLCKAAGYGTINYFEVKNATLLKKIDLRSYECNCTKEMKVVFYETSVDEWVCGRSMDALGICRGDSGMGMICDGSLQAVNVGLMRLKNMLTCEIDVKKSTICRQVTNVGLFVDTCYYLQWLSEFTSNVDPPSFKTCKSFAWRPRSKFGFVWVLIILCIYFVNRPQ